MNDIYERYIASYKFSTDDSYILHNYTHSMPLTAVAAYLLMVAFLPKFLISIGRKGENSSILLKYVMILWNLSLASVSVLMAIGVGVPYVQSILEHGFVEGGLCDSRREMFSPSSLSFWTHIFVLSKFAELLDTFFLIVKKPERPVIFLNYYHHSTVLLASWYAEYSKYTVGYVFTIINACIHSVMYTYYALTEMGYRPNWNKVLTLAQISQMVIGIVVNVVWAIIYFTHGNCHCENPTAMLLMVSVMYGTYLVLFVQFFIKRYNITRSAKKVE